MKFPTKEAVKSQIEYRVAQANLDAIECMRRQVLEGNTYGTVSELPAGLHKEKLIDYFAKNTEWTLTFTRGITEGYEVDMWRLS